MSNRWAIVGCGVGALLAGIQLGQVGHRQALPEDGVARVVSQGRVLLAGHVHGDELTFSVECQGCVARLDPLIAQRVDAFGPAIERYVQQLVRAEVQRALLERTQTAAVAPVSSEVKEK